MIALTAFSYQGHARLPRNGRDRGVEMMIKRYYGVKGPVSEENERLSGLSGLNLQNELPGRLMGDTPRRQLR